MPRTGIEALLEILASAGVDTIFGNPGTTELPLNDALARDGRFRYILGLQEIPVMAMADGYAMASGSVGVVNLHACCGLGNAMGMLYNAFREGTPLLVTAGQQDRRLMLGEPILAGDMVAATRPWTKWAAEIQRVEDVPVAVRRGIQLALTPPTGPVFLSLPVDVQMESSDRLDLAPVKVPSRHIRPPRQSLLEAAKQLAAAERPAILAGSRVTEADAVAELVAVAEQLGAPVYSEPGTTHGRQPFPCDHALFGQSLPLWAPEIASLLTGFDCLLAVGLDLLRLYIHAEPDRAIPKSAQLIHLDADPWQLGKNQAETVSLWGDPKVGLEELAECLARTMSDADRQRARHRYDEHAAQHGQARERLRSQAASQSAQRPMTPLVLMHALARVLPKDVAVIEEAVTTTNTYLQRFGALKNSSGSFAHRGWALGWGLGCALGVQLAWPDRPVLGILGEGAAMYGIQGLWSAAHYQIPAVFVIPNNAQYQILKICADKLGLPGSTDDQLVGLELTAPEVDLVLLAQSMGVEARRVSEPDELSQAVQDAWAAKKPALIDVPIARQRPGRLEYG